VVLSSGGLNADPDIIHGVLPNGFQYVLLENALPEDRVSMHLDVFAGSMNESDTQTGVAHFLEHMLFNGSTHFQPGELIEYFQSIGMDFGADANAHTGFFNTVYDLSLPKGDKKHIVDALVVMEDYAKGALLIEEEVDRERGIILAEKRERDSVSFRTFEKTLKFELPDTLFSKRLPIGTEAILKKADQSVLKAFYDTWYRPDNMVLIMVGDFDAGLAQKLIKEQFSDFRPRSRLKNPVSFKPWKPHKGNKAFYHYEPEAGSTEVTIETIAWTPFVPETVNALKNNFLQQVADSILRNRLSRMVTKQEAGFSEFSIFSGNYQHHLSLAVVSATTNPDTWETTLSQLGEKLAQVLAHGFTAQELMRVKADFTTALENAVKQSSTRRSDRLARMIMGKINNKKVILSPLQRRDLLLPYLESITLEDVNQAFRRTWSQDHRLVLVTGNAKLEVPGGQSPEEFLLERFSKILTQTVSAYKLSEAQSFPYLTIPETPGRILAQKNNAEGLGITQIDFENQFRLNLKKTVFKKGEFAFKLVFGDGKKSEPAQMPGLAALSEEVVRNSGFGRLDADQIEVALAGRDVNIRFNIEEDYFSLIGSSDSNESELMFQLIDHFLSDPGFRQEAVSLGKTRYAQTYESLKRTAEGVMEIQGEAFLAGMDSRFGLPDPLQVKKYTLRDIKNWLIPYFNRSRIELSVVGDFHPEIVIKQASQYLGTFAKRDGYRPPNKPMSTPAFPKGEHLQLRVDTKIKNGLVVLTFLTDDFWDINQTRKLSVLSRVLSEKLRLIIREKLSASYSPYVYNDPSIAYDHYGVLRAVVNVNPETSDFIADEIKKIMAELVEKGVSKKELELVTRPILTHLKVIQKTNRYWLNSVLADSRNHPEKLEWSKNMIPVYASIATNDLEALAKKYLKVDESALIVIQPAE